MTTAKERVEEEVEELNNKMNKLIDFMVSPHFARLQPEMQFLMNIQSGLMCSYIDILNRRLEIWQD